MWFLAAMVAGALASSDFDLPTAAMAARVSPHDLARRVVSHELGMSITAGGPPTSVTFFERGHMDGQGYCIQPRLSVYIGNDGKPHEPPRASTQLRLGGCNGRYAYLN